MNRDTQQALEHERAALDDFLSRAATLPGGSKVFRDKRGAVRTQDGKTVADDIASSIIWRGDEPSYEDYTAQKDRVEGLENAECEIRGIETELGGIRGELTNNDKPPTATQIESVTDQINSLEQRVKEIESKAMSDISSLPEQDSTAQEQPELAVQSASAVTIPTLPKK